MDPIDGVLTGLFIANKLVNFALQVMDKVNRGEMTQAEADAAYASQANDILKQEARLDELTKG